VDKYVDNLGLIILFTGLLSHLYRNERRKFWYI